MKSKHSWKPTKYKYIGNRIIPSTDPNELSPASRLFAQLVADTYSVLLPKYAHGKLLDLGCGRVPFYALYHDLVTEAICIDWQENEHVDLACDLNNPLPFPDNYFDTIICSDVLEYIFRPISLFLEIAYPVEPNALPQPQSVVVITACA